MPIIAPLVGLVLAPVKLHKYAELAKALREGETVRVVLDYKAMKMVIDGKPAEGPDASGGMVIDHWERFGKGVANNPLEYIACSQTVTISHPKYNYVYNYVKLRISSDGKVEVIARYVKPATFETTMDETFLGAIDSGVTLYVTR